MLFRHEILHCFANKRYFEGKTEGGPTIAWNAHKTINVIMTSL